MSSSNCHLSLQMNVTLLNGILLYLDINVALILYSNSLRMVYNEQK